MSEQRNKSPVWIITGSSRGFGRELVIAALEAGDRVAATARNPEQLNDLTEKYGKRILPLKLDVTVENEAEDAVKAAVKHFGQVDVVVNNAGYANLAPIETALEDDFRKQFETNFWGVYNMSRAVLALFKRQRSGVIVQFSSIGGRVGQTPGLGSYQAAKFAVDGFTRVLATETKPFGVRTLVIEPGGFATDWAGSSMKIPEVPEEYKETVGRMADYFHNSTAAGDPKRAAEIIVRVLHSDNVPTHLVLGAGASKAAITYSQCQITEAEQWRQVSTSADFHEQYPVDLPS